MSDPTLLQVVAAQVHYRGAPLFEDLHFTWKQGEHWAIFGDSGRALTGFLETLLGRALLQKGTVDRHFAAMYSQQKNKEGQIYSFRDLMALISQDYQIRNTAGLQNFYYQQRFNSEAVDDTLTVSAYLQKNSPSIPGPWTVKKVAELLRLQPLLERSVLALSNGETRRLSLALGLLRQPKMFLMDQPLTGLDQESRSAFGDFLEECIRQGIHVLCCRRIRYYANAIGVDAGVWIVGSHINNARSVDCHKTLSTSCCKLTHFSLYLAITCKQFIWCDGWICVFTNPIGLCAT